MNASRIYTRLQYECLAARGDDEEARESKHERMAATYAGFMDLAIKSGENVRMRSWFQHRPLCVTDIVFDTSATETRAKLLRALHLIRSGKYAAGASAALEFIDAVCAEYGRDMADTFAGDDE